MKVELLIPKEFINEIAEQVREKLQPALESMKKEDDELFDVKGLCAYLKVSERWVYERTQFKEIPHLKIKGLLRFRKSEIDKWLNGFKCLSVGSLERNLKLIK